MSYTLADLRALVRQRADMENSDFVSTTEVDNYINDSYEELWDLLVATYGSEYFVQVACGTTTADCSAMDLPEDFYKLVAVFWDRSSTDKPKLRPFAFGDWAYDPSARWDNCTPRYRLAANSLIFDPKPATEESMELWYVPQCERLTSTTSTLEVGARPWHEYIVIDAAIKCLMKEESDVSALQAAKGGMILRIQHAAPPRDVGEAPTIVDARGADDEDYRADGGW